MATRSSDGPPIPETGEGGMLFRIDDAVDPEVDPVRARFDP